MRNILTPINTDPWEPVMLDLTNELFDLSDEDERLIAEIVDEVQAEVAAEAAAGAVISERRGLVELANIQARADADRAEARALQAQLEVEQAKLAAAQASTPARVNVAEADRLLAKWNREYPQYGCITYSPYDPMVGGGPPLSEAGRPTDNASAAEIERRWDAQYPLRNNPGQPARLVARDPREPAVRPYKQDVFHVL